MYDTKKISDLSLGETGYVVPWAISFQRIKNFTVLAIRADYSVHYEKVGNVTVKIIMQDGYVETDLVDLMLQDPLPRPSNTIPPWNLLPVVSI